MGGFVQAAIFPAAVATVSDLLNQKNFDPANTQPTLNTTINNSTLTIVVGSGQGAQFPTGNFLVSIDSEIILIASRSTDTFTVAASGRGYEGTTAASHTAGVAVYHFITAIQHNQLAAEVNALEAALGVNLSKVVGTLNLSGAGDVSLSSATAVGATSVTISGLNQDLISGFGASTGTMVWVGAGDVKLSASLSTVTVSGSVFAVLASKLSLTQNMLFNEIGGVVASGSTTAGATIFGSSLFLQRIFIPAAMTQTEVDLAHQISFAGASLSGVGGMTQLFGLFSFDGGTNATLLDSVFSASSNWTWASGSASASLTGVQAGWSGPLVHSMALTANTAGSTSIPAGEYVVGNLLLLSASATAAAGAGGSNLSMSLYGANVVTNLTSASLGALSSGGLAAVSAFTASGSLAAQTAAASLAITNMENTGTFTSISGGTITTATVFHPNAAARTFHTGATGTLGAMSSGGLSAGSFVGTSGSLSALTNVGTTGLPSFSVQGTASAFTGVNAQPPSWFEGGVMATGGIPANITLTSTNVTITGSLAQLQPWFALVGS